MGYFGQVAAATLSGKARLDNQNVFVAPSQHYKGRFDLRSQLPLGDEFVLSSVKVSFKFQDDKEWVNKLDAGSLKNTGRIIRHEGSVLLPKSIAGQTDLYYESVQMVHKSNEEEVAEVTISRNKLYSTTVHRREVTRESHGQKVMLLGTYEDSGDNHNLRKHYRVTDMVTESHLNGYDGPFEIREKILDLTAAQDLARDGYLDFELSGKGDYIFVSASISYQGYTTGVERPDSHETVMPAAVLWFAGVSFPVGGLLWWRNGQRKTHRKQKIRRRRRDSHPQTAP